MQSLFGSSYGVVEWRQFIGVASFHVEAGAEAVMELALRVSTVQTIVMNTLLKRGMKLKLVPSMLPFGAMEHVGGSYKVVRKG